MFAEALFKPSGKRGQGLVQRFPAGASALREIGAAAAFPA